MDISLCKQIHLSDFIVLHTLSPSSGRINSLELLLFSNSAFPFPKIWNIT